MFKIGQISEKGDTAKVIVDLSDYQVNGMLSTLK